MKFLLDTHLLLWAAGAPNKLSKEIYNLLNQSKYEPYFSAASIWEIAIKNSLGRNDFQVNPSVIRRGLLDNGYSEVAITSLHATFIETLPNIHKDPFDRILIAQANIEGIPLHTSDETLTKYPGPIIMMSH